MNPNNDTQVPPTGNGKNSQLELREVLQRLDRGVLIDVLCKKYGTEIPEDELEQLRLLAERNSDFPAVTLTSEEIKALQYNEELFRSIFEHNSAAIGIYEFDSLISMVNEAYCRVCGFTREEVVGTSWIAQIPPDELERLMDYNRQRLTNPATAPTEYEFGFYHKSGEIKYVLASIATNTKLKKIIISFVDVTARRFAEQKLRESEQMFEITFQSCPIPMALTTLHEGKYININEAFLLESGYSKDEVIGSTSDSLGLFVLATDRQTIAETVLEKGEIKGYECGITIKSGEVIPCIVSSAKLLIHGEHYLLSSIINIKEIKSAVTRLEKYSRDLREANATKDKFFSIIAHDLKSPFQGLLGVSRLLQDEYEITEEEGRKEYIRMINEIGGQSYKLLEDLLQWSRMQSGAIIANKEVFNISQALGPTVSLSGENASRKNVTLNWKIDKNIFVHADKNMVQTIVRNLLSNAIKFTKSEGRIVLIGQVLNERYYISVEDTGIGMSTQMVADLFSIEKVSIRRGTDNEGSTGFGLALCKDMVEQHGGRLLVSSQENIGSVFTFSVPLFTY
ncbi:MAG: PAS domain-containing sensor histidine kinase [Ignavibacteria bacterium]|nr:PAS domain-containing sensor histidine kinase [Ignavibacteria bacterium]